MVFGCFKQREGCRIGRGSELDEQIVGQERRILGRNETHLGVQLRDIFTQILRSGSVLRVEPHHGLAKHNARFCATERQHVDTRVNSECPQRLATATQRCRGVTDARSIHMHHQTQLMGDITDCSHFSGAVERAKFSGLGERDHAWLSMMRVATSTGR